MKLKQLVLKNFCQHRDRTVEFSPYLNLLVGPNGSGKSNIVRAMLFALTGELVGAGVRSDDISQFAADSEPSYVQLQFEHSGRQFQVTRSLRPKKVSLEIDGESVGRTVKDIEEAITTHLGLSMRYIRDYVFVPQREIDAWIDKREGDRAADMNRLFGLDIAPKIYDGIYKFSLGVEVGDLVLEIQQAEERFRETAGELDEARQNAANFADLGEDQGQSTLSRLSAIEADFRALATVSERADGLRNQISATQEQLNTLREEEAAISAEVQKLQGEASTRQEQQKLVTSERARHVAVALSKKLWEDYRSSVLAVWEGWGQAPRYPSAELGYLMSFSDEDLQQVQSHTNELRVKQRVLADMLATYEELSEKGVCPTCQRPWTGVQAHLEATREKKSKCDQELQEVDRLLSEIQRSRRAAEMFEQVRDELAKQVAKAKEQREHLRSTSVREPRLSMEELTLLEDSLKQWQQQCTELATRLESVRSQREQLEQSLSSLQTSLAEADTKLAELKYLEEYDESQVRQQIEELYSRRAAYQSLQLQIETLEKAAEKLASTLMQLRDKQRLYMARSEALGYLSYLRSVFHPTGLPRQLSHAYLAALQDDINETLRLFSAPFVVELDERLVFTAVFPDGRRIVDRRLSVGQRVVLSFALRVSMNLTFARTAGLLVLDEAQAYLDERTLDSFPDAIERLRRVSQQQGLQVVFVTHDPRLMYLFDHTIDLSINEESEVLEAHAT